MEGEHGVQLDEAGMEIAEERDKKHIFQVAGIADEMFEVFDKTAKEEDPQIN
jgi:hypothetical protein